MRPLWICAFLLACTGDDKDTGDATDTDTDSVADTDTDTDADTDTDTDTDADTDTDTDTDSAGDTGIAVTFTAPPTLGENTFGAGLTAWLDLETSEPSTLTIELIAPEGTRTWTVDTPSTVHHELLMGFTPEADHDVVVTAHAGAASVTSAPLPWTAEALPESHTPVFTGDPLAAEPGLMLFVLSSHAWLTDLEGRVLWFLPLPSQMHEIDITPRGTLLYQNSKNHFEELELSGELIRHFKTHRENQPQGPEVVEVVTEAMHHDVFEMPNGNFLTLGIEARVYPNYPASETRPGPTDAEAAVAGDLVLEVDPTGAIVNEWALLDIIDPYRIAYNGLQGDYWDGFYGNQYAHVNDWSHGNSIWYDAARDEVVVSLRHQDAVVALDHATGSLSWIFAPDMHWVPNLQARVLQPELPTDLPAYHQHSAEILDNGRLLMFDNGNERASAWEEPIVDQYSRCLEVELDHTAGTWTTTFEWGQQFTGEKDNVFSGSLGDCDLLPQTGHHLITFGNLGNQYQPAIRVIEVDAAGAIVWEMSVGEPQSESRPTMFRSERVPLDVIPGL